MSPATRGRPRASATPMPTMPRPAATKSPMSTCTRPPVDGQRARRLHPGEHDGGLRQAEHHRDDDPHRHRDVHAGRRPPTAPQRQEQREERGPGQREQQHPGGRDADDRTADRGERERRDHAGGGHHEQHDGDGQPAGDGEVRDAAADGQRSRPEEEHGRDERRDRQREHRTASDGGQRAEPATTVVGDRDDHQRHRLRVRDELRPEPRVVGADQQLDDPGGDGVEALRVAGELPGGPGGGSGGRAETTAPNRRIMWTMLKWATLSHPPMSMPRVWVGVFAASHGEVQAMPMPTGSASARSAGRSRGRSRRARADGVLGGPDPRGERAREHGQPERDPAGLAHHQGPPPQHLAPPEQQAAREQDPPGQFARRRYEEHEQGADDHARSAVEQLGEAPEQHEVGGDRGEHETPHDPPGHGRHGARPGRRRRRRPRARPDLDGR